MDALQTVFLILHFLGLAAILGGSLEQWRAGGKLTTVVTLWGARAQLLTGLALTGIVSASDDGDAPAPAWLAVKLLIALAVAAIAEMNAKKATVPNSARLIVALTAVNVVVAVAWH